MKFSLECKSEALVSSGNSKNEIVHDDNNGQDVACSEWKVHN